MTPAVAGIEDAFARVRTPIVAANALDDRWAPPPSRDAFMAAYRNAGWRGVDIDPRAERAVPIGHMGSFRPAATRLWDEALDWLARPSAPVDPRVRRIDGSA